MYFKNRYTQVLLAIAFSFILLMAVRLFLYFSYPDYFSSLNLSELFASLFMGFRVDIAILSLFTSIFWLILLIPTKFTFNIRFRISFGLIWGVVVAGAVFYNIGDAYYFGYVNRHIINEAALLGEDITPFIEMALGLYALQITIGIIVSLSIVYMFYKIFSTPISNHSLNKREWYIIPIVLIIAFLGIRGKLSGKSFSISDAFAVNKLSSGNLALSGVYTTYRSAKKKTVNHYRVKPEIAIENLRDTLKSQNVEFIDDEYPLMRKNKKISSNKPNIIIVVIESLSSQYLDALSHNNFGVTPNLDMLSNQGQLFTNFYANGQRSQDGITTLLTGIVQPVSFEAIGSGLELYGLSYLGNIAKHNGYSTLSMQSSNRRSFRVDVVSNLAGFDEYFGAQDIPNTGDEQGSPQFGTWDGNSFRFLSSKLNQMKEPFLSFFFTSTTHAPFYLPNKRYEKYPHSNKSEYGFLNTINYVDTKIGEFINSAKKQPWFDNTIFIFTADHIAARGNLKNSKKVKLDSALNGFHIPLIVYSPKLLAPKKSDVLSSHADVIPSIIDIAGFDTPYTMIGQSIFDKNVKNRFTYVKAGSIIGLATKNGSLFYNYKNFINKKGNVTSKDEDLLLSIDSAQSYLLKNSKWMRND